MKGSRDTDFVMFTLAVRTEDCDYGCMEPPTDGKDKRLFLAVDYSSQDSIG